MRTWLALLALLPLMACDPNHQPILVQCEPAFQVEPDLATPGEIVAAVGRPVSEIVDTTVRVGGVEAAIVDVDPDSQACRPCEDCRSLVGCTECQRCPTCADECLECAPQVLFEVPDLPAGDHLVTIANRFGTSQPTPLTLSEVSQDSDPP